MAKDRKPSKAPKPPPEQTDGERFEAALRRVLTSPKPVIPKPTPRPKKA